MLISHSSLGIRYFNILFTLTMCFSFAILPRIAYSEDRPCCEILIDQINKFQKVHQSLGADESQYFDLLGRILGKFQDVDEKLARIAQNSKKKWQFNGAIAVANGVAGLTVAGIGAGLNDLSTSALSTTTKMAISAGKRGSAELINQFLYKHKQKSGTGIAAGLTTDKDLEKIRDYQYSIHNKLNRLQAIVDEIARCHKCKLTFPKKISSSNDLDPSSNPNAAVRQLSKSSVDFLRSSKADCNICQSLQRLRNAIEYERYINNQRTILMKNSIQIQNTMNGISSDLIDFLSRNKWDESWTGKLGHIATTALAAAGGPVGFIAMHGMNSLMNYLQGNIVNNTIKSNRDHYRNNQRFLNDNQRWAQHFKEVGFPIHRAIGFLYGLNNYKFGKCNNECAKNKPAADLSKDTKREPLDIIGDSGQWCNYWLWVPEHPGGGWGPTPEGNPPPFIPEGGPPLFTPEGGPLFTPEEGPPFIPEDGGHPTPEGGPPFTPEEGPPPTIFVKAKQSVIENGKTVSRPVAGAQFKFDFLAPDLPVAGNKRDVNSGAGDDPVQGVSDQNGNVVLGGQGGKKTSRTTVPNVASLIESIGGIGEAVAAPRRKPARTVDVNIPNIKSYIIRIRPNRNKPHWDKPSSYLSKKAAKYVVRSWLAGGILYAVVAVPNLDGGKQQ